jgi:hypothetical protein
MLSISHAAPRDVLQNIVTYLVPELQRRDRPPHLLRGQDVARKHVRLT